jgi:hypothetical protein
MMVFLRLCAFHFSKLSRACASQAANLSRKCKRRLARPFERPVLMPELTAHAERIASHMQLVRTSVRD